MRMDSETFSGEIKSKTTFTQDCISKVPNARNYISVLIYFFIHLKKLR